MYIFSKNYLSDFEQNFIDSVMEPVKAEAPYEYEIDLEEAIEASLENIADHDNDNTMLEIASREGFWLDDLAESIFYSIEAREFLEIMIKEGKLDSKSIYEYFDSDFKIFIEDEIDLENYIDNLE